MECNDAWAGQNRSLQVEAMAEVLAPAINAEAPRIMASAAQGLFENVFGTKVE